MQKYAKYIKMGGGRFSKKHKGHHSALPSEEVIEAFRQTFGNRVFCLQMRVLDGRYTEERLGGLCCGESTASGSRAWVKSVDLRSYPTYCHWQVPMRYSFKSPRCQNWCFWWIQSSSPILHAGQLLTLLQMSLCQLFNCCGLHRDSVACCGSNACKSLAPWMEGQLPDRVFEVLIVFCLYWCCH